MIGQYNIQITDEQFMAGMTTSADTKDGGFSPEGYINIPPNVGNYTPPAKWVEADINLTGNIIASCEDPASSSTKQRFFVANNGTFYSWDGTTLSLKQTDNTAGASFVDGTVDLIPFNNEIFCTRDTASSGEVVKLTAGLAAIDKTWWTVTKVATSPALQASVRRPLLVFESTMWLGDGPYLHKIDQSYTITSAALTLAADQSITALGIDPGSGLMLIASTTGANYSGTFPKVSKIHIYDGYSNKPRKTVIINEMVTAFHAVAGTVFVTYGQNLGYWNGSGVTFLRKLTFSLAGNAIAYKHHVTSIGPTLYVVDNYNVLAFGDVGMGKKAFYYAVGNQTNTQPFTCLANLGNNKLGIAFTTNKFFTWDSSSEVSSSNLPFYSMKYDLPRPAYVRGVDVIYDAAVPSGDIGSVYIIDDAKTPLLYGTINNAGTASSMSILNPSSFRFFYPDAKPTTTCQLKYVPMSNGSSSSVIHKIIIYYDAAE